MTVAGSGLRSQTLFAHDTTEALRAVTALINTGYRGGRPLATLADLATFLDDFEFTGDRAGDEAELAAIRNLRPVLEQLWDVGPDEAVPIVNRLLREGGALPQLARHGGWGGHRHATAAQPPRGRTALPPGRLPPPGGGGGAAGGCDGPAGGAVPPPPHRR